MSCNSCMGRSAFLVMWTVMVLSTPARLLSEPSAPASRPVDDLVAGLKLKPAEYLPKTRTYVEQWCKSAPENVTLKSFRQRLDTVKALETMMCEHLKRAGNTAVDDLVAAVATDGSAPVPSTRPAGEGLLVPAEQIYQSNLPQFQFAIDTSGASLSEQALLGAYYHAEVVSAIQQIMHKGQALAVAGEQKNELGNYLLVLPLLHSPNKFDPALLSELPGALLNNERLSRMSDFCLLRAGRLDAAAEIACLLTPRDQVKQRHHQFFVEAAAKCRGAGRPDLAVQCLRSAIRLLEKGDSRIVDHRFAICETWASAKNYALAAGEAGDIARECADTELGGRAIYARLRYLDSQGDAQAILQEVEDATNDKHCEPYLSEVMFIQWRSLRKVGRGPEAGRLLTRYVKMFPEDPHVAEMYYAVAVDCLSAQRYEDAMVVLKTLMEKFPQHPLARRAAELVTKLETVARQPQPGTATRAAK